MMHASPAVLELVQYSCRHTFFPRVPTTEKRKEKKKSMSLLVVEGFLVYVELNKQFTLHYSGPRAWLTID